MSSKMEKKAKHFVRLLFNKLVENEHAKDAGSGLNESASHKQVFKSALDNLPKSTLKTELQKNAATYFRQLQSLTRHSRDDKKINHKNLQRQVEDEPINGLDEPKDANEASEEATVRNGGQTSPTRASKKGKQQKSAPSSRAVLLTSSGDYLTDGGDDVAGDSVARATLPADKMESWLGIKGEGFAFNSYATSSKSDMIDSLTKLSAKKKRRLAPHAFNSLCSGSNFGEFLHTLHPEGKDEPTTDALTLLKQEILAGFGASHVKVLTRCEADCLSGIITEAEKMLSSEDTERMKELQSFILNFLLWVKTQHEALAQCQDKKSVSLTNFEDLAAAMLSIYVDISIVLSRNCEDKGAAAGSHTLSKILLLTGHSQVHQLNLLLQVTSPTAEDCQFMVPVYRHMLSKKPAEMTHEVLIKYLYAVRFSQEVLRDQEPMLMEDIVSVAMTAEPTKEFLQWVFNTAPEAYSNLPESVKCRRAPVVKYLIKQAPKHYLDMLLDIVSDVENESQTLSYETSQDGVPPSSQDSEVEQTGALFFTDTSKDEDLANQIESDTESVGALHSRLDTLMDDLDKESSSDSDADNDDLMETNKDGELLEQDKGLSRRKLGRGSRKPQDDGSELDMDTSTGSDPKLSETLSLEERRYKLMTEAEEKKSNLGPASKKGAGSTQKRPAKVSRGRSRQSSRGREDSDDVLVVPENQVSVLESDKESFDTAKDNLDTTKESIVVDDDDEITFNWKEDHKTIDEDDDDEDVEDVDDHIKDDEAIQGDEDDDIEEVEGDGDDEDSGDEADSAKNPEQLSNKFPSKQGTSPKKSPENVKDVAKKQDQSPDEMASNNQPMCLRSMGAGHGQSSLLKFFSPVDQNREKRSANIKKPQEEVQSDSEDVEVVPDSCASGQEERSVEVDRVKRATHRRAQNWKALQGESSDPEQTVPVKALSRSAKGKQPRTPARKKTLRSDQKAKGSDKPVSSSSEGVVDLASFQSPFVSLRKVNINSASHLEQNHSMIEDAVSEGIRRIRAECVTSPADFLTQPTSRSSASKLSLSKRKTLTITGGVKSKTSTAGNDTPKQLTKRVGEGDTPIGKTIDRSAEKQKGVSPLSPSKVKRVATFGDTYRMLAGISADSQTDPGSLPASQSHTPPKRARLKPKALGEVFAEDTPNQKRSGKKKRADIQPISESSQGSIESGQNNSAKKPLNPKKQSRRTPAKTSSLSSQETTASQPKKSQTPSTKGSPAADTRSDDSSSTKAAVKRRASLPPPRASKTSTKVSRKSLGAKK